MTAGIPILDLTDTQAVLGCVGLTRGDVSDERLFASRLEDDLKMNLYSRLPAYEALVAAGEDPSADPKDAMIALGIKNVARWSCAAMLARRWMLFKQLMSDGKTRNDRFDRMDLKAMQANIEGELSKAWGLLIALLPDDQKPTWKTPTLIGAIGLLVDPITDFES